MNSAAPSMGTAASSLSGTGARSLMTRERWVETVRITGVSVIVLLYYFGTLPLPYLLASVRCRLH